MTAGTVRAWPPKRFAMLSTVSLAADDVFARTSEALRDNGFDVEVISPDDPESAVRAHLDAADLVLLRWSWSDDMGALLPLLGALRHPTVAIFGDIPPDPTPRQKACVREVLAAVTVASVMSLAARERLCVTYGADRRRVVTIGPGATIPAGPRIKRPARPTILTWGPLQRGCGVEHVIDVMDSLRSVAGRPRYVIAGQSTDAAGDAYRDGRLEQIRSAGLSDSVSVDERTYGRISLTALILSAAVVVLPYDGDDEVVSAVLVQALACGRPVVATSFSHARELLCSGAGLVVPHGDGAALAAALRAVLTRPQSAGAMAGEARRLAADFAWPTVAAEYGHLARKLCAPMTFSAPFF